MFLLSNLWHGNITPSERAIQDGSEYQKLSHESTNYMDIFRSELSPSGKKALDDYSRTQMQLADIAEEDAFIRGVRIGAQFILDIISEYKSQLPQVNGE